MSNEIKYTAFIDVLGFSSYIENKITNDTEAQDFSKNLKKIIDYLEYCDVGASSHGGLELWTYGKN